MTESLHRLVYRSTLAIEGTSDRVAAELERIIAASRDSNARSGLTGVLVRTGLTIMQVLEGPRDALEDAYDRISADTRHIGFDLVQFMPVPRREFGDWRMGYVPPDHLQGFRLDGIVNAAAAPDEINAVLRALGAALAQHGSEQAGFRSGLLAA